jgi:hypothetical protein
MMAEVKDWRQFPEVVKAQGTFNRAQAAVSELEQAHSEAKQALHAAQLAQQAAEDALRGNNGSLGAVATARAATIEAQQAEEAIVVKAGPSYRALSDAERELAEVSTTAKRACWPAVVSEYKRQAAELDQALAAALAVQTKAAELHQAMLVQFDSAAGWLRGPDGQRLPSVGFNTHRLSAHELGTWREFMETSGLAGREQKARKLAASTGQALRAMVGA